jgi:AraC-like DNA-binding protein
VDSLSEILKRFDLQAQVFYSGNLCELSEFEESGSHRGHLHILYSGKLTLIGSQMEDMIINQPSLLFFPQGRLHRLLPDPELGADLVCATIEYGASSQVSAHPIASSLPQFLAYTLKEHPDMHQITELLFAEAFSQNKGKQIMINKLCDIFLIHILREVIDAKEVTKGMLAGLADKQIAKVIIAIHQHPEYSWQVSTLAELALMSRSKFANKFKSLIGQTPLNYLTACRVDLAKTELMNGKSVHWTANKVGYENGSALARVFKKHLGVSPKVWVRSNT